MTELFPRGSEVRKAMAGTVKALKESSELWMGYIRQLSKYVDSFIQTRDSMLREVHSAEELIRREPYLRDLREEVKQVKIGIKALEEAIHFVRNELIPVHHVTYKEFRMAIKAVRDVQKSIRKNDPRSEVQKHITAFELRLIAFLNNAKFTTSLGSKKNSGGFPMLPPADLDLAYRALNMSIKTISLVHIMLGSEMGKLGLKFNYTIGK